MNAVSTIGHFVLLTIFFIAGNLTLIVTVDFVKDLGFEDKEMVKDLRLDDKDKDSRTCDPRTRTCKLLVFEDPRGQGLSSNTTTLGYSEEWLTSICI